jgi:hypothetical protein
VSREKNTTSHVVACAAKANEAVGDLVLAIAQRPLTAQDAAGAMEQLAAMSLHLETTAKVLSRKVYCVPPNTPPAIDKPLRDLDTPLGVIQFRSANLATAFERAGKLFAAVAKADPGYEFRPSQHNPF